MRKGPYLQAITETGVAILWQLAVPRPARVVVEGPGGPRAVDVPAARIGEAVISGLAPGSRYRYRVIVDDATWSGELATAPPAGRDAPFVLVVIGDTRSGAEPHRRVIERMRRDAPALVLATGDMVDDGSREDQWQQFFELEAPLLRETVLYPAVGNHDRQGRGRTADAFRAYFSLPGTGQDGDRHSERYYALTYAAARIVVLDSNIHSFALTDQTAWLERELIAARQDPGLRHVFVVMHHPPFSVALHGGHAELRERWAPLFERFRVSAVFSGHDHVYSRAERGGVRYFVSGGGGAPLYARRARPSAADAEAVKRFERAHHYLRVAVGGGRVEVAAIRADGSVIETVDWREAAHPAAAPAAAPIPGPVGPAAQSPTPVAAGAPARAAAPPSGGRGPWLAATGGVAIGALAAARWRRRRRGTLRG
jgi:predicted phosphodiesterase